MNSLLTRLISAAVALFVLWASYFFFQATGVYILSCLVFMLMAHECGSLSFQNKSAFVFLLPVHLIHFIVFYFYPNLQNIFLFYILEIILWLWVNRITAKTSEPFHTDHGKLHEFLFFSLVAPTFLLAHLVKSPQFESLFFLFFVVASFDSLSYFWGKGFGGKIFSKKLYPLSSPSKTIEGSIFAALSCVPITLVLDHYFPDYSFLIKFNSVPVKIALTSLVILAALSGDLSESIVKRSAKIKDSGNLLPGHGGFFDRLDAMLFAGIISYLLLQF